MGKGAQFEDRASRGGAVASTSQPWVSPGSRDAPAFEGKAPAGTRGGGVAAYDVTLTNGRTGGGVDVRDRAALAEARLLETQQVLVQERLQREVAESILAETAKALSAVRRAAADSGSGAFAKDGFSLKGGGEEVNAMLHERLALLKKEHDALRLESAAKETALAEARDAARRLDDDAGGDRVVIPIRVKEMTSADQDELVLSSRALLDRAKELERHVAELLAVDEARARTLAEAMSAMESRQGELKQKLRDHGLLDDDEYDDARVLELSQGGQAARFLSVEAKAALGHMHDVEVAYDGPATSPLGKNFYVTRTAGVWDRWFGTHC